MEKLSIHIETWGAGIASVSEAQLDEDLDELYEALESRGALGTITSVMGLTDGPAASFGSSDPIDLDDPVAVGRSVEQACSIFLDACEEIGLGHGGIALVEIESMRHLERSIDEPRETFAGLSEVAELFGVSRQRVHELRRKRGFPAPAADLASGPVWRVSTLQLFLSEWERKPGRPRRSAEA